MTHAPLIRPATPTDAAAIDALLLYLDSFHAQARPDIFRTPSGPPRGSGFLAAVLADPGQEVFVADLDRVVGYIHTIIKRAEESPFRTPRIYADIDSIAVLPEAQRRGIGHALMEFAISALEEQGVFDQQIAVHAFNARARQLYESLGFAPSFTMMRRRPR